MEKLISQGEIFPIVEGKTVDHMELFRETSTGEYFTHSLNICFSDGTLLSIRGDVKVGSFGVIPTLAYLMRDWSIKDVEGIQEGPKRSDDIEHLVGASAGD